jgi:hypothetical protein
VARYLTIAVGEATGRMRLLDDEAPKTSQAIWDRLPIEDQTIPVRWPGNAWRSEQDYALPDVGVENRPESLKAGDVAYYPRLQKICFAYGHARWTGPHGEIRDMTLFGVTEEGLDDLVRASEDAHRNGTVVFRLSPADES